MTEPVRRRRLPPGRLVRGSVAFVLLVAALTVAGAAAWRLTRGMSAGGDPAFALVHAPAPAAGALSADSFPAGVERLDSLLEPLRARHRAPALALAIVRGERLAALGVTGVRRAGAPEPARWDDRFHIGSDTKSMTATLVAMLIEEGRLRWDTTLPELFPELAARMRPEYRAVTVEMLMHHRSGLPDDRSDPASFLRLSALRGTVREQRRAAVAMGLARPPVCPPGTRNVYANMNYDILGAAVERLTGDPWESQLRRRLFEPLGMRSAGFGSPNSPDRRDQPWGHALSGRPCARLLWTERTRLPAASGPAGNVSLSMSDWARYAALHLAAARGDCRLLSCATFQRLHVEQPAGSHFAAGWGVARVDSGGPELQHAGSDGWWYAVIVISPARDAAILAATNVGGTRGAEVCDDAVRLGRRLVGRAP